MIKISLKHCGVGASLGVSGREFHIWQPLFKKDTISAGWEWSRVGNATLQIGDVTNRGK